MITLDGIALTLQRRWPGGISVYFSELIRRAASSLDEFEVLVHDQDLTATRLGCSETQRRFAAPRILERYRSPIVAGPGLVHSSYYRTTRQPNVRNVVTVYDFIYERYARGPRAYIHSLQKRTAVRHADAVLCISDHTRCDLLNYFPECPSHKVIVTYLAANSAFRPLDAPQRPAVPAPFVLYVSGRQSYKRFPDAVRAVGLTQDVSLVCVGGGPFTTEERALLQRELPGRYYHVGEVSSTALNELYNSAICLLYSSEYEGFGIPVLEAMQAGCPVIAVRRSSIPEVAGTAAILVDEGTPEAFAAAISVCDSGDRRADLRKRGLAQAMQFSWETTFRNTAAVYTALLRDLWR